MGWEIQVLIHFLGKFCSEKPESKKRRGMELRKKEKKMWRQRKKKMKGLKQWEQMKESKKREWVFKKLSKSALKKRRRGFRKGSNIREVSKKEDGAH